LHSRAKRRVRAIVCFVRTRKQRERRHIIGFALSIFLIFAALFLGLPEDALAATDSLEITGEGVASPLVFSREELEEMEQHQYLYSAINTWPTKKWYVGKGVRLWDLLVQAGIKEEATLLKFTAADGYTVTLTMEELFREKRYCFPHFLSQEEGHIPGDPSDRMEVDTIIALIGVEGSDNPAYMNRLNTLQLMLGQRAVTEQTGNLFVKYLSKIEVLTDEPEKWDAPQANPGSGTVSPGTMVTLSNLRNDDDKIYYTTDGTTPTLDSPIYNWISSRWWSARADVLGLINRPIGPINQDTTIKAITIGPGKLNSDVVTFHYRVEDGSAAQTEKPAAKVVKLTIGRREASVDGVPFILDEAPYLHPGISRTLVPVRFVSEALGAQVVWHPERGEVSISHGTKEILLMPGSDQVLVDGVRQAIECPPALLPPGRLFVPLRFVSETLGAQVDYKAETGQIIISRGED
jgi:hypothetical protein